MDPASCGSHQGFRHLIRHTARLPDIEHHFDVMSCQLNIADQRLHHIVRIGEQLELVAFNSRDALATLTEFEQRSGDAAVLFGKDMFAGFEIVQPLCGGWPHCASAFCPTLAQMQFPEG